MKIGVLKWCSSWPIFKQLFPVLIIIVAGFIGPKHAWADWTGISVNIENTDSDWIVGGQSKRADISSLSFRIEDTTLSGLRVGATMGRSTIRLGDRSSPVIDQKFDAEFFGVYLRQPIRINDNFSVFGLLSYRFNSGDDLNEIDTGQIEWHERLFTLGLSARFASFRIAPFVSFRSIDGDVNQNDVIEVFDSDESYSRGFSLDYFVEPSAYLRLEYTSGDVEGGFLRFVREY